MDKVDQIMNRFGMFAFIFAMLNFTLKSNFADEMGGGGAGDSDGGDDGQTDDNTGGDDGDEGDSDDVGDTEIGDDETSNDDESSLSAEEIAAAREIIAERQRTETLNAVEKSIKSRVPNFNMSAVVDGLRALNEKDPQKAAFYNASEAGLEMYYRDHLANVAQSDEHNSGSHSGSGSDFDETLAKARAGDRKATRAALASSKA